MLDSHGHRNALRRESEEFEGYLQTAQQGLIRMSKQPDAFQALFDIVADRKIQRVLDVGCGIGQMLYPFVAVKSAFGIGLDCSDRACRAGRDFYSRHAPWARVKFMRGRAERLPFASGAFDLVNCGLALPYMNNARALDEFARVLRRGGILFLSIHHLRYYLRDIWRGVCSARLLQIVHAGRALGSGAIYHLTGRQAESRLFGVETFQTRWLLRRELLQRGLLIERERSDVPRRAPAFVALKLAR